MATRTLYMHGTTHNSEAAAIIKLDNNLIHSGPILDGILFSFITDVTKHGKVSISIEMLYGKITITDIRVTYPALINQRYGYINMPQPISQPLTDNDCKSIQLPLEISNNQTYNHYMFNGPKQWIVNHNTDTRLVIIDRMSDAIISGTISPNWGYDCISVDTNRLDDLSSLQ